MSFERTLQRTVGADILAFAPPVLQQRIVERASLVKLRLPEELRTDHWYNDWQHAVFVIIFDNLMRTMRAGQLELANRLLDRLTVYLYVHFVCEEEGMTWASDKGHIEAEMLARHQKAHVFFLDVFHRTIQAPYKRGEISPREMFARVEDYYRKILAHIDEFDQITYGRRSGREESVTCAEVAHIGQSGLPLSPNMPGAVPLVARCNPDVAKLLMADKLPIRSGDPMSPLSLIEKACTDGSLRHRVTSVLAA